MAGARLIRCASLRSARRLSQLARLEENLGAVDVELTRADLQEIEEAAAKTSG
jgi:aryl-alcohol dehydrogenase-like predicted oxidoreductase